VVLSGPVLAPACLRRTPRHTRSRRSRWRVPPRSSVRRRRWPTTPPWSSSAPSSAGTARCRPTRVASSRFPSSTWHRPRS